MYDSRTNLSKEIHAALKERFGELMFQTVIRMATKIGESAVADIPLIFYNSRSNAARQYRKLADEIEKRRPNFPRIHIKGSALPAES